jgi:hypothetical protein
LTGAAPWVSTADSFGGFPICEITAILQLAAR